MFVRQKIIKGRTYYYLVRSKRQGASVVQETIEYIGAKKPSKKNITVLKKKHENKKK
jgi:hypothetical protein